MDRAKIIYSISIEDIYTVAEEILERKPTKKEIKFVEGNIGDFISWHDTIDFLLQNFKSLNKGRL